MYLLSSITVKSKKKEESKAKVDAKRSAPIQQAELNMDMCIGANISKSGPDPLLKEDSEYPVWLWGLLEPVQAVDEPDSSTKQYWRKANKGHSRERNALKKQLG